MQRYGKLICLHCIRCTVCFIQVWVFLYFQESSPYYTVLCCAELWLGVISLVTRAGQNWRGGYWAHVLLLVLLEQVDLFLDHALNPIDHMCTDLWCGSNTFTDNFTGTYTCLDDPWGPAGRHRSLPIIRKFALMTSEGLHRVSVQTGRRWNLSMTQIWWTLQKVRWWGRHDILEQVM